MNGMPGRAASFADDKDLLQPFGVDKEGKDAGERKSKWVPSEKSKATVKRFLYAPPLTPPLVDAFINAFHF
jgi:hypothetical protein